MSERWTGRFSHYLAMAAGLLACSFTTAAGGPPGCERGDCGILQAASYEHIVVGRIRHVATDDEMRRLYRWAKAGPWKDFADDEADYIKRNRVFVLPADAQDTPVMLHMSHEEYGRLTFHAGDLVRYTPRMAGHAGDGPSIYSALAGCIAVLCRAADTACVGQYRSGVYRRSDGALLDFSSGQVIPGGITIDPLSLLPQTGAGVSPAK